MRSKRTPYFPLPDAYLRSPTPPSHSRTAVLLPPAVLLPSPASAWAARSQVGQRRRWQGRVTAIVATPPMLCLGAVTDEAGVAVWDCLWLNHTQVLQGLALTEGDEVTFLARVDRQLDGSYVLNRPLGAERIDA